MTARRAPTDRPFAIIASISAVAYRLRPESTATLSLLRINPIVLEPHPYQSPIANKFTGDDANAGPVGRAA